MGKGGDRSRANIRSVVAVRLRKTGVVHLTINSKEGVNKESIGKYGRVTFGGIPSI